MRILFLALLTTLGLSGSASAAPAVPAPVHLRCEYLSDPIGIEERAPRLSWEMVSPRRATSQSAYQVLVAASEAELRRGHGEIWDSGRVATDQSNQVEYAGKPLSTG